MRTLTALGQMPSLDGMRVSFLGPYDAILARPDLSDADRTLVQEKRSKVEDAIAQATRNLAPGAQPDLMQFMAVEEAANNVTTPFIQGRLDFYWIYQQDQAGRRAEPLMLESKQQVYLDLLKHVGLDEAGVAKAQGELDVLAADLAKMKAAQPKPATEADLAKATAEKQGRIEAVRKELRALLDADQRARLDWKLPDAAQGTVFAGTAPPGPRPVHFSKQVSTEKAPEAGTYKLYVISDPKKFGDPAATVALGVGEPVGFRKTDKRIEAVAGKQEIALPDPPVLCMWAWDEPPAATQGTASAPH